MWKKYSLEIKLFSFSVLLGLGVSLLDALIDAQFFYGDSFFKQLLRPSKFEIYVRSLILMVCITYGFFVIKIKKSENEKEKIIQDLQNANQEIKILRGILPICLVCKKVRNDNGYWQQVEEYIRDHTEVAFSHGYCPECYKEECEAIWIPDSE